MRWLARAPALRLQPTAELALLPITKDIRLEPLDAAWHLLNFFGPAIGVGLIAAALAKLCWRSELKKVGWLRLSANASAWATLVSIGGLVVFGHDGRITTYAAMVAAVAFSLWWVGFRPFRR